MGAGRDDAERRCSVGFECRFRVNGIKGFFSVPCRRRWQVAATVKATPKRAAALGFAANLLRLVLALQRPFANQAAVQIEARMTAAGTERLSRVADRRRQLRSTAEIPAVMPHSGFGEIGHLEMPFEMKNRGTNGRGLGVFLDRGGGVGRLIVCGLG